jgi:hypothetical protein
MVCQAFAKFPNVKAKLIKRVKQKFWYAILSSEQEEEKHSS